MHIAMLLFTKSCVSCNCVFREEINALNPCSFKITLLKALFDNKGLFLLPRTGRFLTSFVPRFNKDFCPDLGFHAQI
jgi:hypothetical protein